MNRDSSGRSLAEALRCRQKVARARLALELVAVQVPERLTSQKTVRRMALVLAVQAVAVQPHSQAAEALAEAVEAQAAPG